MKLLFILDPWNTLDWPRDTSLLLMKAACQLGHQVFMLQSQDILFEAKQACGVCQKVLKGKKKGIFFLSPPFVEKIGFFDQIYFRVDPPVNTTWRLNLQVVSQGVKSEFINPVSILLSESEKLIGSDQNWSPDQIFSAHPQRLLSFILSQKKVVLKPMNLAQSQSVHAWDPSLGEEKLLLLLKKMTQDFVRPICVQPYLAGIQKGEVRCWFLDGVFLGCIKKLPLKNDFRFNLDQGSQLILHDLSSAEKKQVKKIALFLQEKKIRLAAVDLIDNLVTDFNFTSPGLLVEMEALLKRPFSLEIMRQLTA